MDGRDSMKDLTVRCVSSLVARCLLVSLFAFPVSASEQDEEAGSRHSYRSENFAVYTDLPAEEAGQLLARLEATLAERERLLEAALQGDDPVLRRPESGGVARSGAAPSDGADFHRSHWRCRDGPSRRQRCSGPHRRSWSLLPLAREWRSTRRYTPTAVRRLEPPARCGTAREWRSS